MPAYGYVRQSRSDEDSPSQSPLVQEERVRAIAQARDPDVVVLPPDLNVSGGKSMQARPSFADLLAAIESGECTAVYAYDLSRLFRNLKEQLAFFELTKAKGIPVRFVEGQVTEVSGPTGDLILAVLGAMNQWQREITSVKIKDSLARIERETGHRNGQAPYGAKPGEDLERLVEAFRVAGSYDGAARRLNDEHFPSRSGVPWSGTVVRAIMQKQAGDEVGPSVRRGARAGRHRFRLSQLLSCSTCGHPLTGSADRRRGGEVRYQCTRSRFMPHARGWVNETKLLPVIAAEAQRAELRWRRLQVGTTADDAKAAALAAERSRVKAMFRKGHMEEPEYDTAMAEIAEAESGLSTRRWIRRMALPPDVERDNPGTANAWLRRVFSKVTVDMSEPARRGPSDWRPTLAFEWRDPAMRLDALPDDPTDDPTTGWIADPDDPGRAAWIQDLVDTRTATRGMTRHRKR